MTTAVGVLLFAIGAVLTFAVDARAPGINVTVVGALLMLLGTAGVSMAMMRWTPRRRVPVDPYRPSAVARATVRL